MPEYIAYYRVSTDRQGQSGLGLEAQRQAVAHFIGSGSLAAEFEEVESGKRHKNRPALVAALNECRRRRATLVIAKLDRLARNVHFISGLIESRVEFVCCDNPQVHTRDHQGRFFVHQLAVMAEFEAGAISQRTKDALAVLQRRGVKLGNPRWQESLSPARQARDPLPIAPPLLEIMQRERAEGQTFRQIAGYLNQLGLKTPKGFEWYASTVRKQLMPASVTRSVPV